MKLLYSRVTLSCTGQALQRALCQLDAVSRAAPAEQVVGSQAAPAMADRDQIGWEVLALQSALSTVHLHGHNLWKCSLQTWAGRIVHMPKLHCYAHVMLAVQYA